ncbi:MAG: 16S rRNA (uracil(1498)-N(3))-methyltransferase [Spirochaetaceae bacterium]|nr:16S rRNA (uracil(1498)-N(3))-methyltransferase [Spirochaetaceae bacterium]
MNIVLFENSEINLPLSIDDNRAKHIIQILHKKEGEFFDAGIIGGKAGKAKILKIDETGLNFEFTEETDGKSLYPLSMIIGFPRPIQLKRLFRDMAGLGTESIHLTGTELGEKSYMQSNIVEKGTAYNLLKEGTIQAKSTHIPELILHQNLSECVEKILKTNYSEKTILIALDNVQSKISLTDFLDKFNKNLENYKIFAAIGSERGWTDKERNLLVQKGFTLCSMGTRVLRTETASTVAASIILSKMGVLS